MWPFKKQEKDLTKITNERCIPVALEIVKMIGNYDKLTIGEYDQKKFNEIYKDLVQDIKKLMLEKELLLDEINYVLKLVDQPLSTIKFIINENFNKLLSDAQDRLWGKPKDFVSVNDLDELLKDK